MGVVHVDVIPALAGVYCAELRIIRVCMGKLAEWNLMTETDRGALTSDQSMGVRKERGQGDRGGGGGGGGGGGNSIEVLCNT